jgi:transposase-like protein
MSANLQDPRFIDETAARQALEAVVWPNGPTCPHCGNADPDKIAKLATKSARPGLHYCNECKGQFTATVGTLFERSKIPLSKWWLAMHLLGSSKKSMSSHQLHRMLGISYKSTWFMMHRIREAMNDIAPSAIGGSDKIIEADESYIGGKAKNRAYKPEPKKHIVMSLVERGGEVRSFHVKNATAKTLRETAVKIASRKSYLMTDENTAYTKLGKEFSGHGTVNHSADEYVRLGGFVHVNTALKIIFPFSSAALSVRSITLVSNICTAILPSSISATTIVLALASKTKSASPRSRPGSLESA